MRGRMGYSADRVPFSPALNAPEIELPPPLRDPSPCDECGIRTRCAAGLACEAFEIFVKSGKKRRWGTAPRQPSGLIFDRVFTEPFKKDDEPSSMSALERRAAVKRLAARGHSRNVIAEMLDVAASTVRRDLLGLDAPARKPGIYRAVRPSKRLIGRRAAVEELAGKGHSRREIANLLGIDKQKVSRDLLLANATAPTPETPGRERGRDGRYRRTACGDLRLPAVKELAAKGHSAREIAGLVGVHLRTVFSDLKLLGGPLMRQRHLLRNAPPR